MTDMDETAIITPQTSGTTPGGLPFPNDDEAVMLGAQAIKALAQAIDARPWWNLLKWTSVTYAGAADIRPNTWDLVETNIPGPNGPTGIGGAADSSVIVPRAGLYDVTAYLEFSATWAGGSLMSVGAKTSAVPPREIFLQRAEFGSAGAVRRCYLARGLLRLAAGESCWLFLNNANGSNVTAHNGAAPGDRHTTRFSGQWVAP